MVTERHIVTCPTARSSPFGTGRASPTALSSYVRESFDSGHRGGERLAQ